MMNKHRHPQGCKAIICCLGLFAAVVACTTEEPPGLNPNKEEAIIPVQVNVSLNEVQTRAPGDAGLSVNRILIVPFRKINESLPDDPANYRADFTTARQIAVTAFPASATMLYMQASVTYRILILGYNWMDYDFASPSSPSRRFDIGPSDNTATLANLYLKPTNVGGVPEFFSCQGIGYLKGTAVGVSFRPEQINGISGTLQRIVSGLTLTLNQIPGYVKSVTLSAEQWVTATRASDGNALQWQMPNDGASRVLGTKVPVAGSVTFNQYVLPIPEALKTTLYLDIAYGTFVERHTVLVADYPNVVSTNRITFNPNQWVKLTGSYSTLNYGFTLANNVNLDDNAWDGIQ